MENMGSNGSDTGIVPPLVLRSLAVYYCARGLIGYLTPGFDELQKARARSSAPPPSRVMPATVLGSLSQRPGSPAWLLLHRSWMHESSLAKQRQA
jgi:hypothetical protein